MAGKAQAQAPEQGRFKFDRPEGFENTQHELFKFTKPGDHIQGVLIQKVMQAGKFNTMQYLLKCPDGETRAVFGSAVIDTRMELVKPGDEVFIGYAGDFETANGQKAKDFEVFHKSGGDIPF